VDIFYKLLLRFLPCAFSAANFNRIHGGTVGLFLYKSADALATMVASAYFDTQVDKLRNGDIIIIVDTNVPTIDVLTVTSADNVKPVTVLNGT